MIIKPLRNKVIVITRPEGAGASLMQRIRNAGGEVVHLPVMKIAPISAIRSQPPADIVIFISANAVTHGMRAFGGAAALQAAQNNGCQLLTIGSATTAALAKLKPSLAANNQQTDPTAPFDSEQLLASNFLQQVDGKSVQIVRGVGGRDTLAKTLAARGAKVQYVEVYRRCPAGYSLDEPAEQLLQRATLFTVASGESLKFLHQLIGRKSAQLWQCLRLVVPSERVLETALRCGLKRLPLVADNASDSAMFAAILHATRQ